MRLISIVACPREAALFMRERGLARAIVKAARKSAAPASARTPRTPSPASTPASDRPAKKPRAVRARTAGTRRRRSSPRPAETTPPAPPVPAPVQIPTRAEPTPVPRYALPARPAPEEDRGKAKFDAWMKEEAERNLAKGRELAERALSLLSADAEDLSLDAAIARTKP